MEKIKNIREPWSGKMTPKERFLRQMNFKSVDRTVNMEFGYWEENFTLWKMFVDNDYYKQFASGHLFFF